MFHKYGPFVIMLTVGTMGFLLLASQRAAPAKAPPDLAVPNVNVQPADRDVRSLQIQVNGNVMPLREIRIAAEVAGRIISKLPDIRAGRFVEQGTELCRLDAEPYRLELNRLDNELAQVEVDLRQLSLEEKNTEELIKLAQEDLERAEREVQRLVAARQNSNISDIITAPQLDQAKGEVTRMKNALQTWENNKSLFPTKRERLIAQKDLTEARKKIAQLDLDRTVIVAPISGVIASETIEEGNFVQRGTELLMIEDVSQMEVSCNLLTEDLYWIWASGPNLGRSDMQGPRTYYSIPDISAVITLKVGEQQFQWSGKLTRLEGSALNEKTRTVPCRVRVETPLSQEGSVAPPALARGMFVSVVLSVPQQADLVRIPEQALRMNSRIFTTTTDGDKTTLHVHKLKVARTTPGSAIARAETISPPLEPGAELVVSPLQYATEGMQVKIEPLTQTPSGDPDADPAPRDQRPQSSLESRLNGGDSP